MKKKGGGGKSSLKSRSSNDGGSAYSGMSFEELLALKSSLQDRLDSLGGSILTTKVKSAQQDIREGTAHWDYLLKEMEWMAGDFKREAKWKEQHQKKIAKMAIRGREKVFDRDMQNSKHLRQTARKLCTRISREMRSYWDKIDRIVIYKHKTEFQARQQAAMDKHLNYLVSQTERYSTILATRLQNKQLESDASKEINYTNQQLTSSPTHLSMEVGQGEEMEEEMELSGDEEMANGEQGLKQVLADVNEQRDEQDDREWEGMEEEDDEEGMEDEDETKPEQVQSELDVLKREAEMSPEELRKLYYGDMTSQQELEEVEDADEQEEVDEQEDREWEGVEEEDDEEGMDEEDETKPEQVQSELDILKREAEMSPEELRKLYYGDMNGQQEREQELEEVEDADEQEEVDEQDDREWEGMEEEDDEEGMDEEDETKPEQVQSELDVLKREAEMSPEELRKLYYGGSNAEEVDIQSEQESLEEEEEESEDENQEEEEEEEEDVEMANGEIASQQEHQQHYSVPFLISKDIKLREYQRAGLDWLVSLWERRLNGILADEMGLGKTLQTITLLAHLASERGLWGPHLIIVPTSVLLNWEMEFKKFCPGFKVLTYYGTAKDRKQKRTGWSRPNSFHVCITSYQLAVQDANILKRKKWYYMILDEAHNIKNFRSQRWQTLLNFNTKRRLLLTGTPLQNSLMELWSLMHFLMPHIFRSQSEFKYWFSNPLNAVVEGKGKVSAAQAALAKQEQDRHHAQVIKRLHTVMRPFLLRRLKVDVATQLPGKFEHLVRVPLSRRQRFLYEDFISRSSTRKALTSGGYLGMMAILMKLRMVCNHPDIFEPRVVESPFTMEPIKLATAALSFRARKRFHRSFNGRDPLAGLELDIGGEFGLASREAVQFPGRVKTKRDAQRIHELRASKSQLIQVVQAIEFKDASGHKLFHTFDDAGVSSQTKALIAQERLRLKQERENDLANLVDTICSRAENYDRLAPMYGEDLIRCVTVGPVGVAGCVNAVQAVAWRKLGVARPSSEESGVLGAIVPTLEERVEGLTPLIEHFAFITPKARASTPVLDMVGTAGAFAGNTLQEVINYQEAEDRLCRAVRSHQVDKPLSAAVLHPATVRLTLAFPDKMLVQYDCGKLQVLAEMLRKLKAEGHRVLIFTQMTRMLDILEIFLNIHGHVYFRLDGATKVDERQRMMEKFNRDTKIFAFILSTRSGGLGINLTGADTVIFYDSDWNPSMDAQAQDRAHRIGQTRDVHIYRLISEHTIEENILTKANQKRELNKLSVEDGKFTVSSFLSGGGSLTELLGVQADEEQGTSTAKQNLTAHEIEAAMASVEDESDKLAAKRAQQEVEDDMHEFDESAQQALPPRTESPTPSVASQSVTANKDKGDTAEETLPEDTALGESQQALMTQDQFQEIEKQLRPVERYSIVFRTYWYPIVNALQAELDLQAMEQMQEQSWEVDRLEEEKELMEDEGEEELITAIDGRRFDISQYLAARSAIKSAKIRKLLTCSGWETHLGVEGRRYYWNSETGESTWTKPFILQAIEDYRAMRKGKWKSLHSDILVRVFQFADSPRERLVWSKVCKHWQRASVRPELFLWVCSETDPGYRLAQGRNAPQFPDDWMTIGTWVEALYEDGEVWYPCMISDVHQDGTYQVTYTDGFVEPGLRRSMLRLDTGSRYNYVNPSDGSPPYGVFNKYYCSRYGTGPRAPDPRKVASLARALDVAQPGEVIVLRAGIHMAKSLKIRHDVMIISESALADMQQSRQSVLKTISGEHDPGGRTGPANPWLKKKKDAAKKNGSNTKSAQSAMKPTAPPPVEVIGIEADDKDFLSDRHIQRRLEETLCSHEILYRSPSVAADNKDDKMHTLWAYEQTSAIECYDEGLTFQGDSQIILRGVCVFRRRMDASNNNSSEGAGREGTLVEGSAKVWFHDCTLSHLFGTGSALEVRGKDAFALLSWCLVSGAPGSGILLRQGKLALLDSDICLNGRDGVTVGVGSVLAKRCMIYGNENGVLVANADSERRVRAKVCLVDCDLTDNAVHAVALPKEFSSEHISVTNSRIDARDKFEVSPWLEQDEPFELRASLPSGYIYNNDPDDAVTPTSANGKKSAKRKTKRAEDACSVSTAGSKGKVLARKRLLAASETASVISSASSKRKQKKRRVK